ncbi:MAG: hypothetical protein WA081_05200 [Desulfosalsimonadaceae bacterium]
MKKIICMLTAAIFAALFISLTGCSDNSSSDEKKDSPAVKTSEVKELVPKSEPTVKTGEVKEVVAASAPSPADNNESTKKYSMKSGTITFERTGVSAKKKIMVYFDDYGAKERNEVYNNKGKLEEFRFSDGETMYKISLKKGTEKVAYNMGPGSFGTEMKFVAEPFKNPDEQQQQNFKKLPDMKILGKTCQAYSVRDSAAETTFAGYNGVLLYVKVIMKMGESFTQAVDFKEDAKIDPALFKVPDGYAVKKYK